MSAERAIADEFGFTTTLACEIEFYLPAPLDAAALARLQAEAGIEKLEQERGAGQWEVALPVRCGAQHALADLLALKQVLTEFGADFSAKPFADQPGSGLHVHVHLENARGETVFFKHDAEISDELKWSIGGLLACMREHMPIFAPNDAARARFVAGSNAPTTLSWGANNRTCAIRLPDLGAPNRHIEHRVACADADPASVIEAILEGIYVGLKQRCDPGAQTYGDATRPECGLPPLF